MATDKITARRTGRGGSDVGYLLTLFNRLVRLMLNRVITEGNIGIATTTTKARNTATINFLIDGEFKAKASTDDLWTLAGTTVAAAMYQVYHLYLDTAGAASIGEGTQASTLAGVRRPAVPDGKSLVGYITVQTVAATFIPGTTALNAGGQTVTYVDGIDKAVLPEIADYHGSASTAIADELPAPPV